MARGHFSTEVKKVLMQRTGARCARTECGKETLGPSATLRDKGQVLGVAAHIKAASVGGPRYDNSQSDAERHAAGNGLWLCESCAALIDKNNGSDFSVEKLNIYKIVSEKAALERLMRSSETVRDNCVQTLIFINVPRLQHYVSLNMEDSNLASDFVDGIPGDRYIAPELFKLSDAISRIGFRALDWREAVTLFDDPVGLLIRFEGYFWTKNCPRNRNESQSLDFRNSENSPHVYAKDGMMKFVLPYDPRFITTNTAFHEFNSGRIKIGGFGIVKSKANDRLVATPLIIGLASTPEVRSLLQALAHR